MSSRLPVVRLGDYCEVDSGFAFKSERFSQNPDDINLVKGSNLGHKTIDWNEGPKWPKDEYEKLKFYELKYDDVVLAMDRPIVGGNLKFAWITESAPKALLVQRVARLRAKNGLEQKYLRYVIADSAFQLYIDTITTGANIPHISGPDIRDFKFHLPPIATQSKIATILSAYDDLIENNLKRIKLLEEMAQITYEEWFVRLKFPGHETTQVDSEKGLPEGWLMNKVGNLLAKIATTTKIKSSEYCTEGKFPIIDQSREYIAGYTNDEDSIIDIVRPIIVFGDHTRILKLVNFPFARGADGTQILLSKDERMPQHLFYFSLLAVDLSNYHYARHFKFLKDCELILPDLNTAQAFENVAAKNFELTKNLRNQNKLLKEARDILLPRLMTGMIDVEQLDLPEPLGELSSNLTQESQAA